MSFFALILLAVAQAPEAKKPRVETAAPAATNSAKPAKCVAPPAKKEEDKKKALDPKDFMFSNLKGQVFACFTLLPYYEIFNTTPRENTTMYRNTAQKFQYITKKMYPIQVR